MVLIGGLVLTSSVSIIIPTTGQISNGLYLALGQQTHLHDIHLSNHPELSIGGARNYGATQTNGDILVFIDSDVLVPPDAIEKIVRNINCGFDAVIGIYGLDIPHKNFASQYKNRFVHNSYMKSSDTPRFYFGAIGGVTRKAFEAVGGFNESRLAGEDVDFGMRLVKAGFTIYLDKTLEVSHLRRYSCKSVLLNDFRRARDWTYRFFGRSSAGNASKTFLMRIALSYLTVFTSLLGRIQPSLDYAIVFPFGGWLYLSRVPVDSIRLYYSSLMFTFLDDLVYGLGVLNGVLWRIIKPKERVEAPYCSSPIEQVSAISGKTR